MIEPLPHAEGCILRVRVQPGARKNAVAGERAGAVKIAVTAAPERGKANQAVVEVLAQALQIQRGRVELLSGESSRDKRFLIRGIGPEELVALLAGKGKE